jgi:hypothetical protein
METMVYFPLSHTAWRCLGFSDPALVAQAFPTLKCIAWISPSVDLFAASASDAACILDDLHERSLDVIGGFEHPANERRSLKLAHQRMQAALANAEYQKNQAAWHTRTEAR